MVAVTGGDQPEGPARHRAQGGCREEANPLPKGELSTSLPLPEALAPLSFCQGWLVQGPANPSALGKHCWELLAPVGSHSPKSAPGCKSHE